MNPHKVSDGQPAAVVPAARYEAGLRVRREVLGRDHVERSLGDDPSGPDVLQQMITEFGWGFAWSRDELSRSTRSLITIALLTALNREHELRVHLRGALRNGCTHDEIREAVVHCAPYCGLPASIDAMRIANEVLAEEPPMA